MAFAVTVIGLYTSAWESSFYALSIEGAPFGWASWQRVKKLTKSTVVGRSLRSGPSEATGDYLKEEKANESATQEVC